MREKNLPCLFFRKLKTLLPIVGAPSKFPVKEDGLGLKNPITSANEKYNSSLFAISELIGAVKGERDFSTANHIRSVKGKRWYGKKYQDAANDVNLQGIVSDQSAFKNRLSLCAKHIDDWLSVWDTTDTVTVLAITEF